MTNFKTKRNARKAVAGLVLGAMVLPLGFGAVNAQGNYEGKIKLEVPEAGPGQERLALDGAQYKVLKVKTIDDTGKATDIQQDQLGEGTTLTISNFAAELAQQPKGVYKINQVKRAPGYLLDAENKVANVELPVMENGRLKADQTATVTLKANQVFTGIEFKKTAPDGTTGLQNATFKLKRIAKPQTIGDNNAVQAWEDIDEEIGTANSVGEGTVTFSDLKEGKYEMEETVAPSDYEKSYKKYTFTVTTSPDGRSAVITDKAGFDGEGIIKNYQPPVVDKKIMVDPNGSTDDGGNLVSTNNITPTQEMTYLLTMRVPENVDTIEKLTFSDTVNSDMEILGAEFVDAPAGVTNDMIKHQDPKISFTIRDNNTTDPEWAGAIENIKGQTLKIKLKVKVRGIATASTITNTADIVYDPSNVPGVDERTINTPTTISSLVKGKITLTKQNSDGELLVGVKFRLEKEIEGQWKAVKEDGYTEVQVGTTDESEYVLTTVAGGLLEVNNLPLGKYRFVEVETLDGYRLKTDASEEVTLNDGNREGATTVTNFTATEVIINTGSKSLTVVVAAMVAMYGVVAFKRRKEEEQSN